MLEAGVVCDRCDTLPTRRCVRVLIALLGLISSVDRDVQMQPMFVLSKVPRDDKAKSSKSNKAQAEPSEAQQTVEATDTRTCSKTQLRPAAASARMVQRGVYSAV